MEVQQLQTYNEPCGKVHYIDYGKEDHGNRSFRLWVDPCLVGPGDTLALPAEARVYTTRRGGYSLKQEAGWTTYNVYIPCGYRGGSYVSFTSPPDCVRITIPYFVYLYLSGSEGIGKGFLVSVKGRLHLTYSWGRYGIDPGDAGSGVTTQYPDGRVDEYARGEVTTCTTQA